MPSSLKLAPDVRIQVFTRVRLCDKLAAAGTAHSNVWTRHPPMKIFVTPTPLAGYTPIHDDAPAPRLDYSRKYLLMFESGKTTMKVLRQLHLKGRDAYFQVKNLEYFIQKLGPLRNLEMEILGGDDAAAGSEYTRLYYAGPAALRRYSALEKKYRKQHGRPAAGIDLEISFCPRLLESTRTSLREPGVYKSDSQPCHRIYALLEASPRSYEELLEVVEQTVLDATLKSLIFSGIVKQKGGSFCISPVLL